MKIDMSDIKYFNLEYMLERQFQISSDGQQVFFPYGNWTKGRIVDSPQTYAKLKNHLRFWTLLTLLLTPIAYSLSEAYSWHIFATYLFALALANYADTAFITRKLDISDERLVIGGPSFRLSRGTSWFLFIAGIPIFLVGALIALVSLNQKDTVLGIVTLALGLALSIWGFLSLFQRN